MRTFLAFAAVALVACSGSGSGSDGGSSGGLTGSQCSETATQICQKAESCSTGHDGGYTVIIQSADPDSGVNSSPFTINGDVSHCDKFFLDLACAGSHAAAFTSVCGAAISGLQCGTDSTFGGGVVLPYPCSQDF